MEKLIKIRAHHAMCLLFFKGKGYNSEFTKNMQMISDMLKHNPKVKVILNNDLICDKCPNLYRGYCKNQDLVKEYDKKVMSICGLNYNCEIYWNELKSIVKQKIIYSGKRTFICGYCEWTDICNLNNKDNKKR